MKKRGASLKDSLPRLAQIATGGSKQDAPTDLLQLKIADCCKDTKAQAQDFGQVGCA
jgi:hypothetical protein